MENRRQLSEWVQDARKRTLELVEDLTDDQLMGPQLAIINPLLWEIGHVAWFQEKWVLRHIAGQESIRPDADALYDSAAIAHDTRWDLPLSNRNETLQYLKTVSDRVVERLLEKEPSDEEAYFVRLSVFHADMHTEAFTYTRQTLGYPRPKLRELEISDQDQSAERTDGSLSGDVVIRGGEFWLGATPNEPFVFDNEKWAHPVQIPPFSIVRAPVTQEEFAAFVDEGGYRHSRFWSEAGWRWRQEANAENPIYWRKEYSGGWLRRDFDRWLPLEPDRPAIHINWYEADAYCRWAGRRLPTESEWEFAAAGPSTSDERHSSPTHHLKKRCFPWGNEAPTPRNANLDWR